MRWDRWCMKMLRLLIFKVIIARSTRRDQREIRWVAVSGGHSLRRIFREYCCIVISIVVQINILIKIMLYIVLLKGWNFYGKYGNFKFLYFFCSCYLECVEDAAATFVILSNRLCKRGRVFTDIYSSRWLFSSSQHLKCSATRLSFHSIYSDI